MATRKVIPIKEEKAPDDGPSCGGGEPYALMVLGDSMLPEFTEGEIIIVEPEGLARDGSFVIAYHDDEYIFRQLVIREGRWFLKPLNDLYPVAEIPGASAVKSVITQKKRPGKRSSHKYYV